MIGYNGNGRNNMVWNPDTGKYYLSINVHHIKCMCTFCGGAYVYPFSACMCTQLLFSYILCVFAGLFVYSCGCVVVVEDLHTGSQRQWFGHTEEISTLAVTHDAQVPHRHDQLVMLY